MFDLKEKEIQNRSHRELGECCSACLYFFFPFPAPAPSPQQQIHTQASPHTLRATPQLQMRTDAPEDVLSEEQCRKEPVKSRNTSKGEPELSQHLQWTRQAQDMPQAPSNARESQHYPSVA